MSSYEICEEDQGHRSVNDVLTVKKAVALIGLTLFACSLGLVSTFKVYCRLEKSQFQNRQYFPNDLSFPPESAGVP